MVWWNGEEAGAGFGIGLAWLAVRLIISWQRKGGILSPHPPLPFIERGSKLVSTKKEREGGTPFLDHGFNPSIGLQQIRYQPQDNVKKTLVSTSPLDA